jgi:PAS domain-containing protein
MKPCKGDSQTCMGAICFPDEEADSNSHERLSEFLPPERDTHEQLNDQQQLLSNDSLTRVIFDGFPDGGFILNANRQIVATNRAIRERFKIKDESTVIGLRPGEALGCKYAHDSEYGCGTTRFCRYCGAAHVLFRVRMGQPAQEQCYVVTDTGMYALELLIWGTPFKAGGMDFTLFAVADISHERRRQALERIFFHDALNTVNGLLGATELLSIKAAPEVKKHAKPILEMGDALAREIKAQRQLLSAESGTLEIDKSKFLAKDLLRSVVRYCSQLSSAAGRTIEAHSGNQDFILETDVSLMRRILTNLVKNALEASKGGDQITLYASQSDDSWIFSVHNGSFISVDDQHNLFKRSFSTKGVGRGLGLYSVRLLTEKYLKGAASYKSEPENGTTFVIALPKE